MSKVPILLRLSEVGKTPHLATGKGKGAAPRSALEDTIEEAHSNNYYGVCVDITNDLWKTRWSSLCLSTAEGEEYDSIFHCLIRGPKRSDVSERDRRASVRLCDCAQGAGLGTAGRLGTSPAHAAACFRGAFSTS